MTPHEKTMVFNDIIKIVEDYTEAQRNYEKEEGFERIHKQGKLTASQEIQMKILELWRVKIGEAI